MLPMKKQFQMAGEMMAFKPDGEFKGVKDKFVFDLPKKE